MNSRAQAELDRLLEPFGVGLRVPDPSGQAIYQLEPGPPKTVVVCIGRHDPPYAAFIPSIPKSAALTWTCGVCEAVIPLAPPRLVLEYGLDTGTRMIN